MAYTLEQLQKMGAKPVTPVAKSYTLDELTKLGAKPVEEVQPMEVPKLNYEQRVAGSFKEAGKDIVSTLQQKGQEAIGEAFNPQTPKTLARGVGSLFQAGLRTAGTVAREAFTPLIEFPVIKQAVEGVANLASKSSIVQEVVADIENLKKTKPEFAKDLGAIANIVTLGTGKAIQAPLKTEARLLGQDIAQVSQLALKPTEEAVQSKIISLFQKSIKPTAKKSQTQIDQYARDTVGALKTIKANSEKLNIQDATGELISGRTPQTINELGQALDQTKDIVFRQYDGIAKRAGKAGAVIDAKPIANEIEKVATNKALQLTNPEVISYAQNWAERLRKMDVLDTETSQAVIQNLNSSLQTFYRNPTYDAASKVVIDAGVANNFRKALDKAIETATGEQYQVIKNQYKALKTIENDVVRAVARDARKNVKGLLDYTDMFTSGQMLTGMLSLNPAMFTKGAVERGFKEWIKTLNDPNRAIKNIFEQLDITTTKPFTPQSGTMKYIQNPKVGLSVSNITKNIPIAQKGSMMDFVDYVNGAIRTKDRKYINSLRLNAQEIASQYRFSAEFKGDKALARQFGEYLDYVGYDRTLKRLRNE